MNHYECTCCRHWRAIEQLSAIDAKEQQRLIKEGKLTPIPMTFLPARQQLA